MVKRLMLYGSFIIFFGLYSHNPMQEKACFYLWGRIIEITKKFNDKANDEAAGYETVFARQDYFKEIVKYANNELTWPQFLAIYKRHYNIEDKNELKALKDMFFNELYCEQYDSISRILLEHDLKKTAES